MAQHDMNIANQGFPATRADLNNALQALATNSSGTSAPSTTFANQWWYDTTNNKLYIRNEANNAWIQVAVLDQTNNEWQITTGQISAADGDGLVFKTDDGTTRITLSDGGDVTFADGTDIITATAGTDNVRLGQGAGDSIASGGTNNVTIGKDAGTAITTGDANVAVGKDALKTADTCTHNVALGLQSLFSTTSAGDNTAVGNFSLYTNTAIRNTAMGYSAMYYNTSGSGHVAVGYNALLDNTTGNGNVAVGFSAGANATTTDHSVFVGYEAGGNATLTGHDNTFVGMRAGYDCTSGQQNTGIGREALANVTTGSENTACGNYALGGVTAGDQNVAVGYNTMNATVGEYNTGVGYNAMAGQSSGDYNVAIGYQAAQDMTTGSDKNTCVGGFAGNDMTSGAQLNVFVGYSTTAESGGADGQIVLGTNVSSLGSYYTTLGRNSDGRVYNNYASNATWTRTSDERIKKDIQTNTDCGLDFINDLRTVTYKWKAPSEHPETFLSYDASKTEAAYTEKMYGFIAQEVKQAMDDHNITDFAGWHVTSENQGSQQGISYEMFVMPLVKAVQELSAKVDTLETENTAIKARLDALEA